MRWIVIIALLAVTEVVNLLSYVMPVTWLDYAMIYGGIGVAGVVVFRLSRAWDMPRWVGYLGLALPVLLVLIDFVSGVLLYEMTPFLLFNMIAVALLTFGSWTGAMLEWADNNRNGRLLVQGFLFPALYALCALPLAGYIDTFLPERRLLPIYYNATTSEFLLGLLKLCLNISGFATAIGAAVALVFLIWLTFLQATGFRRNED